MAAPTMRTTISADPHTTTMPAGLLDVDIAEEIALLESDDEPFISLLMHLNKDEAKTYRFEWLEDQLPPREDAINKSGGYAAGDVSFVVDHGAYFRAGSLIKVPRTGENIIVTVVATNTLTVERAYGETSAAAIVDNEPLLIICNVSEMGSGVPVIIQTMKTIPYNYTYIQKTVSGIVGTLDASRLHGGSDLANQDKKNALIHKRDIARAFWFSERSLDTGSPLEGNHPICTTRGAYRFIELAGNETAVDGLLTEDAFDTILNSAFKYGARQKYGFFSTLLMSVISGWAKEVLKTVPSDKSYGINIQQYIGAGKTVNLIEERIFEVGVHEGLGIIMDLVDKKYRPLRTRDTVLQLNVQARGADEKKNQYMTDVGFEMKLPEKDWIISGVEG